MSPLPALDGQQSSNLPVREDWLAQWHEDILEPNLPIVDPHHHPWDRPGWRYLLDELLADLDSGHNVVATVFVQCRAMYRRDGAEELRPLGETEFVNGIAAMSASGRYGSARVCAGIVGHADLGLGARVEPVLEAHLRAAGGRFRGIRHITTWDADSSVMNPSYRPPPGLLGDQRFREGFAKLAPLGLAFDAWLYHPQIDELTALAQKFPDARIVLDHVGGPLGTGRCMFESNFPVDKGAYSYAAYWNACKHLTRAASAAEKADLFRDTAARFYGLELAS